MTIVFLLSVASRVANSCVLVSVTLVVFANALVGFASANPESILPLMNFIVLISTCVVATSAATVACLISAARRAGLDESKMPRGTGHTEADAMPLSIHHQPSPDVTITAPVEVKADSEATEVAAVQAEDDSSRHTEQGFVIRLPVRLLSTVVLHPKSIIVRIIPVRLRMVSKMMLVIASSVYVFLGIVHVEIIPVAVVLGLVAVLKKMATENPRTVNQSVRPHHVVARRSMMSTCVRRKSTMNMETEEMPSTQ